MSPHDKPRKLSKLGRIIHRSPIRFKVAFILVIPLAALLLFSGLRINDSRLRAQNADELGRLTQLGVHITALTHELQQERARVVDVLTAGSSPEAAGLFTQGTITDEIASEFSDVARPMAEGDASVPALITRTISSIDNLPQLRTSVSERQLPAEDATGRYTALISDLLSIVDGVAELAVGDRNIANHIQALAAFARYKEYAAQETYVLFEVILNGSFGPGQYHDFVATLIHQETHLSDFRKIAPEEELVALETIATRAELSNALELEERAIQAEDAPDIGIESVRWSNAMAKKAQLLRTIELENVDSVIDATITARDSAIGDSLVEAAIVLLALVVAIVISLLIARSMVRPLVRLRTSALDVAYNKLPDLVKRFKDSEDAAPDPAAEARRAAHSVKISSTDEIGQVATAFNAVHQEAVRVAAEQAQLRHSVAAIYVNLARRSQLLVERLIRLIDKLEQGERDPDRLAELFRVDHLATRMRRNDENLLILAGAEGGRTWPSAAPLVDVLRAAIAEVEMYTRVSLGHIDSVDVEAKRVSPVVHIVAELLENATMFSPPHSKVTVNARVVSGQAIIEIADQGIGMSPEQLREFNDRLADDPSMDVNVSRMMGLFVVARLANRSGIRVVLRSAQPNGTLAIVALPADALVGVQAIAVPARPELPGKLEEAGTKHAGQAFMVPPQRNSSEHSGAHAIVTPSPPGEGKQAVAPTAQLDTEPIPTQWRFQPTDTDPTVEVPLPIFEQIESEWFRSPHRSMTPDLETPQQPVKAESPKPIALASEEHTQLTEPETVPTTVQPASQPVSPPHEVQTSDNGEHPSPQWEGPADAGWRRAADVSEPRSGGMTTDGLPKRIPMANYVPGGVDDPGVPEAQPAPASHRSPDAVRGVLSSYRRGFEQGRTAGRTHHTTVHTSGDPNETTDEIVENAEEK